MRFSRAVVKYRVVILIVALLLLVPSVMGMLATRINYDMLTYLPKKRFVIRFCTYYNESS